MKNMLTEEGKKYQDWYDKIVFYQYDVSRIFDRTENGKFAEIDEMIDYYVSIEDYEKATTLHWLNGWK